MARDTKKSFFELEQENNYKAVKNLNDSEIEDGELDATVDVICHVISKGNTYKVSTETVDMNALDYEENGSDREDNDDFNNKKKSESMAIAFGVQVKNNDLSNEIKSKLTMNKNENDKKRQVIDFRKNNDDRHKESSRPKNRHYDNRHNTTKRFQPVDRRRRSRSPYDSRNYRSVGNRRSRDRRQRFRSRDRRNSISAERRRTSRNHRRSTSRRHSRNRRSSRSKTPADNKRKSRSLSRKPESNPSKSIATATELDHDRLNKEKMMKRAEAILLLKDHMRKEIEEQERRRAEKQQQERAEASLELERLEQLKRETLEKLKAQEEIKQLVAVKKVLEVVVSSVKSAKSGHKKTRRQSSSSSSSDDRRNKKKAKRSERRKRNHHRRSSSSSN